MSYLIGVDIGTSGTKTVLFDLNGAVIASSYYEYPLYQPKNGWAEQDALDWWKAACQSIKDVLEISKADPHSVKGVGLSGQMHGLVMLDKNGEVLRKSIIWCDQRTDAECEEITGLVGAEELIKITANPALTGFTASKILWVRNNEPEIFERCHKILLPKDYIRYMLTGEYATEVSDASGMQLLDVPNRCWSKDILQKLSIDMSMLGEMHESFEITGEINGYASNLCGLPKGTPVVGGAGDQAACAVGNGIVEKGVVSSTIGTSGVVFAHADRVSIDLKGRVHTFCHAVPGAWHVMGVTQGAGLSLKWFRDHFCENETAVAALLGKDPYEIMDKEALLIPPGSNGIIYLPYLMGERTPHLDPYCRGVFFGLSARHTKGDMLRSVMEGVGYSLMDCMDIIKEMDIPVTGVIASGGGGKSKIWRQMQSDMFHCPVQSVQTSESGTLGAAILAGVGTGAFKSVQEACRHLIKTKDTIYPDHESTNIYIKYHEQYQSLYHVLKLEFKKMNELT